MRVVYTEAAQAICAFDDKAHDIPPATTLNNYGDMWVQFEDDSVLHYCQVLDVYRGHEFKRRILHQMRWVE